MSEKVEQNNSKIEVNSNGDNPKADNENIVDTETKKTKKPKPNNKSK